MGRQAVHGLSEGAGGAGPGALILTYHAIEAGPAPLCVHPTVFEAHAEIIAESGAPVLTVRELAEGMGAGTLTRDAVAITFDDGFSSVIERGVPALEARGMRATLFCVAGRLGGASDWPSARRGGFTAHLASASALAELVDRGFEIGSHGLDHAPLAGAPSYLVQREVVSSRHSLEDAVGSRVTSYAYPYGALPGHAGASVVAETYDAACTTALGRVSPTSDLHLLPRVDAHYVRNPDVLRRLLAGGLTGYLRARGVAVRVRRALVRDYDSSATGGAGA